MKNFIALLVFIVITTTAFGQTAKRDVLYLKNGSIIKGTIVEQTPPTQLKIQTADGSLFVFKYDEILKIEREDAAADAINNFQKPAPPNISEYGGHFGLGFNLLGGGLAGVPVRYNIFRKLAVEASINIVPDIYSVFVYDGSGIQTNTKDKGIYKTSPAFIGGIDWFGSESFDQYKNKIVKNGLLLRAGENFAHTRTDKFFILGWAHETFKPAHKKYSYLYEMGFGILNSSPEYGLMNPVELHWNTIPFLYMKIHWNWYLF